MTKTDDVPRLLTEAEWQRISAPLGLTSTIDQIANALRERGLIAPEPVDVLLEEAETLHQEWIARKHEDAIAMLIAALRRGMELAAPTLTREMLGDAIVKVFGEGESGFARVTPNNITALHAALTDQLARAADGGEGK